MQCLEVLCEVFRKSTSGGLLKEVRHNKISVPIIISLYMRVTQDAWKVVTVMMNY